jgi:uncharacterized protein (DUF3084 family)
MEEVERTYPLEEIVNQLVSTEFQYEILTAKSAQRTERKLQHYLTLRAEMVERHAWELKNMDNIIERYRKPLEIREKAMKKREEKIAELKGKLEGRQKAIASLGSLPPPVNEIEGEESEEERIESEIVAGVKTYSMPR